MSTAVTVYLPDVDDELARKFFEAIAKERVRAHEKHGATSMEQAGTLSHRRASILSEEAVECGKALNDFEHGAISLYTGSVERDSLPDADELDKELIQTAAMAYTWWANRRGDCLAMPRSTVSRSMVDLLSKRLADVTRDTVPAVVPTYELAKVALEFFEEMTSE